MDEMRGFEGDKARQFWLWRTTGEISGEPLVFHFRTREYANLDELLTLFKPFNIRAVRSDNNFAYVALIGGLVMRPSMDLYLTHGIAVRYRRYSCTKAVACGVGQASPVAFSGGWGLSMCVYLGTWCSDPNRAGTLCRLESDQATGSRWNVCGENMR
ncbi:MAG: IS1 family transposase [Treponema sp.]|nr:IS1 family transposase [Treponema sp.]